MPSRSAGCGVPGGGGSANPTLDAVDSMFISAGGSGWPPTRHYGAPAIPMAGRMSGGVITAAPRGHPGATGNVRSRTTTACTSPHSAEVGRWSQFRWSADPGSGRTVHRDNAIHARGADGIADRTLPREPAEHAHLLYSSAAMTADDFTVGTAAGEGVHQRRRAREDACQWLARAVRASPIRPLASTTAAKGFIVKVAGCGQLQHVRMAV